MLIVDGLIQITHGLGVSLTEDESFGPTHNFIFLRLEIDTVSMMVRVSTKKCLELVSVLQDHVIKAERQP